MESAAGFSSLFNFSGRRNRTSYLLVMVPFIVITVPVAFSLFEELERAYLEDEIVWLLIGVSFILAWIYLSTSVQRFTDIGVPGWLGPALLIGGGVVIPFGLLVFVFLLLMPGKKPAHEDLSLRSDKADPGASTLKEAKSNRKDGKHDHLDVSDSRQDLQFEGASAADECKSRPDEKEVDKANVDQYADRKNEISRPEAFLLAVEAVEDDSELYLRAANEMASDLEANALWIKCLTLNDGDQERARYEYIRRRVAMMKGKVTD